MDVDALNRTVLDIQGSLEKSRVGLKEDVFKERHLPTILKHGKPTLAMQIELAKIAGGETKRLNIINEKGDIVLTLPSALSSGGIINNPKDKKAISAIKGISDYNPNIDISPKSEDRFNNRVNDIKDKHIEDLKTDWSSVITHYKDTIPVVEEIIPLSNKPKNNMKKNMTFEY